jgi:NAD(P)H-dependent flavin oxidoreductase YrpB (nitropropane dioxygenase family)
MVLTKVGYGLSALLGASIIAIGTRFLLAPRDCCSHAGHRSTSQPVTGPSVVNLA